MLTPQNIVKPQIFSEPTNSLGPKIWLDQKNSKLKFFQNLKFFELKIFLGTNICFWSKNFWTKNLFEVQIPLVLEPRVTKLKFDPEDQVLI